jgi:hypothetical protein
MPTKQLDPTSEGILEQSVHMAGLSRRELQVLNLFPDLVSTSSVWVDHSKPHKRYLLPAGLAYVERMRSILDKIQPKVIVTLGQIATFAFTKRTDYTDIRGYPFESPELPYRVIPSLHPRDMVFSNYDWRFYLSYDIARAKAYCNNPTPIWEPTLVIPNTYGEACAYLDNAAKSRVISFDIEVSNYEVSCIAVSDNPDVGISIPFDERWTESEETMLWNRVSRLLENPEITKVGQNFIFDMHFMAYRMGIVVKGPVIDTMISQSLIYPDFLKGLGYLGSVYITTTYWKDQGGYKSIKENN